jgi:hypothetical protein
MASRKRMARADECKRSASYSVDPMANGSMSDVEEVALELAISRAPLCRLIEIYRQIPTVEALEPRTRGRRKGTLFLDKARHVLIRKTICEVYLKPHRPTPSNKFTCALRNSSAIARSPNHQGARRSKSVCPVVCEGDAERHPPIPLNPWHLEQIL